MKFIYSSLKDKNKRITVGIIIYGTGDMWLTNKAHENCI